MSILISEFEFANKLTTEEKNLIASFFIFDDNNKGKNIIYVTNNEIACGYGTNGQGCLGFGHDNLVEEPEEINELSSQSIDNFFKGHNFMLALNNNNEIYSWGLNMRGQLGIGQASKNKKYFKPEQVKNLENIQIEEISCGFMHTLLLSSNNEVYGWGSNFRGQLAMPLSTYYIPIPLKLNSLKNIKHIVCGGDSCFAITSDGRVLSWGDNGYGILGCNSNDTLHIPYEIKISNVRDICLNSYNSLFLTNNKDIYLCGQYPTHGNETSNALLEKINKENQFEDISSLTDYNLLLSLKNDRVFKLKDYNFILTNSSNFWNYYKKKFNITYKTSNLKKVKHRNLQHGSFSNNYYEQNYKRKEINNNNNIVYDKFECNEEEYFNLGFINSGGFGKVYKVKNAKGDLFAIKIINTDIAEKYGVTEKKINDTLESDYVVNCYNTCTYNREIRILMEYCFDNLKNIEYHKEIVFNRDVNNLSITQFFISIEIFKELTEAVNFLHTQNPPLAHRDLKPANILITVINNKHVFKIADFGLSKFLLGENIVTFHSANKGTRGYMPQEVKCDADDAKVIYDPLKVDIHCLGIIAIDLLELNNPHTGDQANIIKDQTFKNAYLQIEELLISCTNNIYTRRPNCCEIRQQLNNIDDKLKTLKQLISKEDSFLFAKSYENKFFYLYLCEKLNLKLD